MVGSVGKIPGGKDKFQTGNISESGLFSAAGIFLNRTARKSGKGLWSKKCPNPHLSKTDDGQKNKSSKEKFQSLLRLGISFNEIPAERNSGLMRSALIVITTIIITMKVVVVVVVVVVDEMFSS